MVCIAMLQGSAPSAPPFAGQALGRESVSSGGLAGPASLGGFEHEDSRMQTSAILDDIDLDLDTTVVNLRGEESSLRLIEVFHDNKPQFSSDSRVWEAGVVLARCLRPRQTMSSSPFESLLRDDLVSADSRTLHDNNSCSAHEGRVVIDLGSGTGVVGLAVARLGLARDVFLTDMEDVVPLLMKNAELNAAGHFAVSGQGDKSAIVRDKEKAATVSVHAHPLDWRETGDGSACRFAISRELFHFNQRALGPVNGVSADWTGQRPFDRITIFASDCVYSPQEIDPFIGVLQSLVADMKLIPGLVTFELILTVKMRLYSETNRSACVKFLGKLGHWICGGSGEGAAVGRPGSGTHEQDAGESLPEPVWASPSKILEVMRAGNREDDLARRCDLTWASPGLEDKRPPEARLELRDVKWKHRNDLVGDLQEKKTHDIAILRITGVGEAAACPALNN